LLLLQIYLLKCRFNKEKTQKCTDFKYDKIQNRMMGTKMSCFVCSQFN